VVVVGVRKEAPLLQTLLVVLNGGVVLVVEAGRLRRRAIAVAEDHFLVAAVAVVAGLLHLVPVGKVLVAALQLT
jgi:hypothetical protein